jgi:hypothetical protein
MSAHESMEHAEHAEHASGSNKKIALLIAVLALFLAISETLGKGAQTESISKNVEGANLWAFFQAKSIRRTVVVTAAEQGKLTLAGTTDDAMKAVVQKQVDDWTKTGPHRVIARSKATKQSRISPRKTGLLRCARNDGGTKRAFSTAHRAWCTLLRKRWIRRSVRDDQPSPLPEISSRMRRLIGSTSSDALARSLSTRS